MHKLQGSHEYNVIDSETEFILFMAAQAIWILCFFCKLKKSFLPSSVENNLGVDVHMYIHVSKLVIQFLSQHVRMYVHTYKVDLSYNFIVLDLQIFYTVVELFSRFEPNCGGDTLESYLYS